MFKLADRTQRLLDLFAEAPYGAQFTYGEILRDTGVDVLDGDRGPLYTVKRILEREHRRTLTNVRGVGYRLTNPSEFVHEAAGQKRRAGKTLVRAYRTGQAAPLDRLNDRERVELTNELAHISAVQVAMARKIDQHDRRISKLERKLGVVEEPPVEGSAVEEAPEGA